MERWPLQVTSAEGAANAVRSICESRFSDEAERRTRHCSREGNDFPSRVNALGVTGAIGMELAKTADASNADRQRSY
jgi:hypothetical protein